MLSTLQKHYFDLLYIRTFIRKNFMDGTIKGNTLKRVLFSTEKLDEKEYQIFRQKEIDFHTKEHEEDEIPGLNMLEEVLDKLTECMIEKKFSFDSIYKVIFGSDYIKKGQIVTD